MNLREEIYRDQLQELREVTEAFEIAISMIGGPHKLSRFDKLRRLFRR